MKVTLRGILDKKELIVNLAKKFGFTGVKMANMEADHELQLLVSTDKENKLQFLFNTSNLNELNLK